VEESVQESTYARMKFATQEACFRAHPDLRKINSARDLSWKMMTKLDIYICIGGSKRTSTHAVVS
jgi:hypothetical protein